MKKRIVPFVLAAAMLPFAAAQEPAREGRKEQRIEKQKPPQPKSLLLGERVNAEVTLHDLDGKPQRAGDLMGKITVVNFFSIRCPMQRGWNERLARIQREFAPKEVVFLHVDSNVDEIGEKPPKPPAKGPKPYHQLRLFLQKNDLPFRVLVDHRNVVADMFQAKTTPQVYVFGRDGRLCYKGLVDDDEKDRRPDSRNDYLRDVLGKLVAGKEVKPFETKEVGGAIKRVGKVVRDDRAH